MFQTESIFAFTSIYRQVGEVDIVGLKIDGFTCVGQRNDYHPVSFTGVGGEHPQE